MKGMTNRFTVESVLAAEDLVQAVGVFKREEREATRSASGGVSHDGTCVYLLVGSSMYGEHMV
jgi:hypothetical protein